MTQSAMIKKATEFLRLSDAHGMESERLRKEAIGLLEKAQDGGTAIPPSSRKGKLSVAAKGKLLATFESGLYKKRK